MAKLDWTKNRAQHILNKSISSQIAENTKSDFSLLLKKGVWPIKGKHQGKRIESLSTSYLSWIKDNFDSTSLARQYAIKELQARHQGNHTAHKVSGPDTYRCGKVGE